MRKRISAPAGLAHRTRDRNGVPIPFRDQGRVCREFGLSRNTLKKHIRQGRYIVQDGKLVPEASHDR